MVVLCGWNPVFNSPLSVPALPSHLPFIICIITIAKPQHQISYLIQLSLQIILVKIILMLLPSSDYQQHLPAMTESKFPAWGLRPSRLMAPWASPASNPITGLFPSGCTVHLSLSAREISVLVHVHAVRQPEMSHFHDL